MNSERNIKAIKILIYLIIPLLTPLSIMSQTADSSIIKNESIIKRLDVDSFASKKEIINTVNYLVYGKEKLEKKDIGKKYKKSCWEILPLYIPLVNNLLWLLFIISIIILGKSHIIELLKTLTARIKQGSEVTIGPVSVGKSTFVTKTADIQKSVDEVKIYGNPDNLKLLFKVDTGTMKKSTKAMEIDGGCLIQVSTKLKNTDGSWSVAEALTFAPNAKIIEKSEEMYILK